MARERHRRSDLHQSGRFPIIAVGERSIVNTDMIWLAFLTAFPILAL
jgi:hypothetical protein